MTGNPEVAGENQGIDLFRSIPEHSGKPLGASTCHGRLVILLFCFTSYRHQPVNFNGIYCLNPLQKPFVLSKQTDFDTKYSQGIKSSRATIPEKCIFSAARDVCEQKDSAEWNV
jgi:hypothetical protein